MTTNSRHSRFILLAVIAGAVAIVALKGDKLDPDLLDAWLADLGILAPAADVAHYALGTVLFAPGALFTMAGGVLFGPFRGTLLNLTGATVGAGIAFLVARYLAGDRVADRTGGPPKRLVTGVEDEGWRFVAFVRLVPLFPFNLTNNALGLTRIPFLPCVVTAFVTMAPGAVACTWLGYAGREALDGNTAAIRYGLFALGLLAAIAALPRLVKRLRGGDTPWIDPEELRPRLENGERLLVLDVRSSGEFTGPNGQIEGALDVPLQDLADRLVEIRDIAPDAINPVCRAHRRSASAENQLRNVGFQNLSVLRGGMVRCHQLGYQIAGRPDRAGPAQEGHS